MKLLEVKGLRVAANGREILHGVNLSIGKGETVVITGKNGAGKSTLGMAVMGAPGVKVMDGKMVFDGKNLGRLKTDARARAGIFMSAQAPVEIPGVSMRDVLLAVRGMKDLDEDLARATEAVGLDIFMTRRELNVGFSGGERKKGEIVQMMCLRPKLAILDEIDSGLDREAARRMSGALREYQERTGAAYLVITHNQWVLSDLRVDKAFELSEGLLCERDI